LQSQDARLFFSPKQLLKFTRNKHNSCFAKPNLKSSQSKGEIAVCAKPTLKYRSHLKHRAHKLFKPSADLFLIGNLPFAWLCDSDLCKIYVDFVLVVMAIYVKLALILL